MINLTLRILLISGSLLTLLYMLIRVRIARMQIKDSIFWIFFLLILLIFSIFPSIATWFSKLLQFQSPINFILLLVVFTIIIQLFFISMKLGKTNADLRALTQRLAIDEKNRKDAFEDEKDGNKGT